MRKIILGLSLFLLLVIGVVAYAVANVNTYLEENRDTLGQWAGKAAGREISYEGAEVAFADGLAIRVKGLRVSEDPRFGQAEFLSLDDAYVGVAIWPALRGRIEVSGVRLDGPTIRVIENKHGYNFSSLGATAEGGAAAPSEDSPPMALAIAALEIVDGTVYYEDRTSADGIALVIRDLDSTGTDLALDGPVAIDFSGRAESTRPAAKGLESRIAGSIRLESAESAVGTLHLESPRFHPLIVGLVLEEGGPTEAIDDFVLDLTLAADPATSGLPIKAKSKAARLGGFDFQSIDADLVYRSAARNSKLEMPKVVLGLAGGTVDVNGSMVFGTPGRAPFSIKSKLENLDSGEIAHVLLDVPTGLLTGRLGGNIDLKGDSLDWETLKRSLAGNVSLQLGQGALEQVNLLDRLVGRLVVDPGLGSLIAQSIRDVAPSALKGDRTPFREVGMLLELSNGAIRAKDMKMLAGDFALELAGSLGLDGKVDADGQIRLSEALSAKLLAKADRFAPLFGDGKTVVLPLSLTGTAGSPTIAPNLAALTQKATANAQKELSDRAARELGKALFGKPRQEEDPARAAERDSTEGLVREGLGRLLGR